MMTLPLNSLSDLLFLSICTSFCCSAFRLLVWALIVLQHVRRAAVLALSTAAHNKPNLIKGLLPELLPLLYDQTVVKVIQVHEYYVLVPFLKQYGNSWRRKSLTRKYFFWCVCRFLVLTFLLQNGKLCCSDHVFKCHGRQRCRIRHCDPKFCRHGYTVKGVAWLVL